MKAYTPANIRNVAIVGHGGNGKTTLAEAMLFNAGLIDRMGRVEDGNTVSDYDGEEKKRHFSINVSVAPYEWKDVKVNLIDVPGYFDFIGEMPGALAAADNALIVVGAVSGLDVGAEKAWKQCDKLALPHMVLINGMDKENADYFKVLSQLQDKYGSAVAPILLPIMKGDKFVGVANAIDGTGKAFDGKGVKDCEVPADVAERIDELRESLMESAAESNEELLDKFFEEGELSEEEIQQGIREGIAAGTIVPVICAAAAPNLGVTVVMDMINSLLVAPSKETVIDAKSEEETELVADPDGKLVIRVWKTVADPFVGKISLLKVLSGTLKSDSALLNTRSEKNEKPGNVFMMRGQKQVGVDKLIAGDIGAIAKLTATSTGDTLCDPSKPMKVKAVELPTAAFSMAVTAKKSGDEDKVISGLRKLEEEDPTFHVHKNAETGDMLVSGQGEMHLDVVLKKLAAKSGVEGILVEPRIPYRETIRKKVEAQGRHKKQSGGHGQFGDCWVRFEPIMDGSDTEFEFVDAVVGGVVPKNFIPAVEKGLRDSMNRGVLAGFPMVNVRCTLYDGSYHPVDSSEMAFKTAARLAFKKGCALANPVLLEPIYHVEVTVPDEYMGDIIGDMNKRRGRIMGMNPVEDGQQVVAEVPLSEIFKYATDLRSMTQARGSYVMSFERYEEVPGNLAQKIIEKHKVEDEEEE